MGLTDIDTMTPQVSILGAILLKPDLMGEAMTQINADDFTAANCRIAWQAMCRIFREGRDVDPVLLRDALTGYAGATELIVSAMDAAPSVSNFGYHLAAMKRQSMLLRLQDLGNLLSCASDLDEAMELLDKANDISIQRHARDRRNMSQMLKSFGQRHSAQVAPRYLQWPFQPLNKGIKVAGGKYLVIGGYPSDGKTAFALACAMVHAGNGCRTIFYSFETDANTVEDRLLANIAQVNLEHIQDNSLIGEEWERYAQACGSASEWPFEVVAAAGMTVDDIRADALAHHASVVYIDYLQLISIGRRSRNVTRYEEVSEISRQLQQFAKTTGITVICLSQMTRPQPDKKGNVPEPTMHNLRESGQIEQDADVIMLLYRMDQKNIRAPRRITVAKNKEGRTGRWWLDFDGQYQRFAYSDHQGPPEGMPIPKGRHKPTPVLQPENQEQQMSYIDGEDPDLPFKD